MLLFLIILLLLIKLCELANKLLYKRKINKILRDINTKQDLLYLNFKDYMSVISEVLKRMGYAVRLTEACGIEGSGLTLNNIQFAEVWKHGIQQSVDVELAMNLSKCMKNSSIHRGMLITLGDFKPCTLVYCHTNVIDCINGDRLLAMCKSIQNTKVTLEPAK